jgi:hypothetical protein
MPAASSDTAPVRRREMPVWLPWLAAPAFALLPVMGCGAAAQLRKGPAAAGPQRTARSAPPLVPIAAVVTAVRSGR